MYKKEFMKKLSVLKLSKSEAKRLLGGYSCSAERNYECRESSCTCREQLFYNNSNFTDKDANKESDTSNNVGVYSHQKNPDYYTL